MVDRLHGIVHRDWENSQPLDLSDEGLLADLQDAEEAENLGLSADRGKHDKKRTEEPARPTGDAPETHQWKQPLWLKVSCPQTTVPEKLLAGFSAVGEARPALLTCFGERPKIHLR